MENSDVDWEKKRAIKVPEYDWKNGSPEEFYKTFVKRPHPVVLRGFMKNEAQKLLRHISKSNVNSSTNLLFQMYSPK